MGCRAENSFTHRHLCEFTGLDFEMVINEHYNEVMDVIDKLFVYIFNGLNAKYGELSALGCHVALGEGTGRAEGGGGGGIPSLQVSLTPTAGATVQQHHLQDSATHIHFSHIASVSQQILQSAVRLQAKKQVLRYLDRSQQQCHSSEIKVILLL